LKSRWTKISHFGIWQFEDLPDMYTMQNQEEKKK